MDELVKAMGAQGMSKSEVSLVVSKATLVAYAVSESGEREIVGVEVADGEMEDAWRAFLGGLVARGLRQIHSTNPLERQNKEAILGTQVRVNKTMATVGNLSNIVVHGRERLDLSAIKTRRDLPRRTTCGG